MMMMMKMMTMENVVDDVDDVMTTTAKQCSSSSSKISKKKKKKKRTTLLFLIVYQRVVLLRYCFVFLRLSVCLSVCLQYQNVSESALKSSLWSVLGRENYFKTSPFFKSKTHVIQDTKKERKKKNGETGIRGGEKEEEEGERKSFSGACCEFGAFKAWADEVVDRVGVAS